MQNSDVRTLGYVLKRTNYGEYDRILNLLTPIGKFSVIAKGVRKEKSKLAGGVEIFTLTDFNIHFGKGEMGVVTGAKMIRHYGDIVKDFDKMELAAKILKDANKTSEGIDTTEYFKIIDQSLMDLNVAKDLSVVEAWYFINLRKIVGEEINLYRDTNGERLKADKLYRWDNMNMTFEEDPNGDFGEDAIKMLRLMASSDLNVIRRVKVNNNIMSPILRLIHRVV